MPIYPIVLVVAMLMMTAERMWFPGDLLAGIIYVVFLVGALMMAFQGFHLNRAALRNPRAQLLVPNTDEGTAE